MLVALAGLIRTLHEASAGWAPPGAVWGGTPANPERPVTGRTELVSHCDYYPGNVVFRDGLPVALIDFDLAHPTTRLYDIANALCYHEDSRASAELDPVFRKLWEDGAKDQLPRASSWWLVSSDQACAR